MKEGKKNKFHRINTVLLSDLGAADKCTLLELIVRGDEDGKSWPTVQRLCMSRGIKHEKNFKGADVYLPGLVAKSKRGRKNVYVVDLVAVDALPNAKVILKHTDNPASEGPKTPACADDTPARSDQTPWSAGANSSSNTSMNNSSETSTATAGAVAQFDGVIEAHQTSSNQVLPHTFPKGFSTERRPASAGVSGLTAAKAAFGELGPIRPRLSDPEEFGSNGGEEWPESQPETFVTEAIWADPPRKKSAIEIHEERIRPIQSEARW